MQTTYDDNALPSLYVDRCTARTVGSSPRCSSILSDRPSPMSTVVMSTGGVAAEGSVVGPSTVLSPSSARAARCSFRMLGSQSRLLSEMPPSWSERK